VGNQGSICDKKRQNKRNVPIKEKIHDIQAQLQIVLTNYWDTWHKKKLFHWNLHSQPQDTFSSICINPDTPRL